MTRQVKFQTKGAKFWNKLENLKMKQLLLDSFLKTIKQWLLSCKALQNQRMTHNGPLNVRFMRQNMSSVLTISKFFDTTEFITKVHYHN